MAGCNVFKGSWTQCFRLTISSIQVHRRELKISSGIWIWLVDCIYYYFSRCTNSLPCLQSHEWLLTCGENSSIKQKMIRSVDLDEENMISTAIYTRLACVTLPLNGITYKVAFLIPGLAWIIMCSLQRGRHRVRIVNSKSYSGPNECQKCFCARFICCFVLFSFHGFHLMNF